MIAVVVDARDEHHVPAGAAEDDVEPLLAAAVVDRAEVHPHPAVGAGGVADAHDDDVALVALHVLEVLDEQADRLAVLLAVELRPRSRRRTPGRRGPSRSRARSISPCCASENATTPRVSPVSRRQQVAVTQVARSRRPRPGWCAAVVDAVVDADHADAPFAAAPSTAAVTSSAARTPASAATWSAARSGVVGVRSGIGGQPALVERRVAEPDQRLVVAAVVPGSIVDGQPDRADGEEAVGVEDHADRSVLVVVGAPVRRVGGVGAGAGSTASAAAASGRRRRSPARPRCSAGTASSTGIWLASSKMTTSNDVSSGSVSESDDGLISHTGRMRRDDGPGLGRRRAAGSTCRRGPCRTRARARAGPVAQIALSTRSSAGHAGDAALLVLDGLGEPGAQPRGDHLGVGRWSPGWSGAPGPAGRPAGRRRAGRARARRRARPRASRAASTACSSWSGAASSTPQRGAAPSGRAARSRSARRRRRAPGPAPVGAGEGGQLLVAGGRGRSPAAGRRPGGQAAARSAREVVERLAGAVVGRGEQVAPRRASAPVEPPGRGPARSSAGEVGVAPGRARLPCDGASSAAAAS